MSEKTDDQLKKEMIKKVDLKKCIKLYAMSMNMKDKDIFGFDKLLKKWADSKLWLYKLLGEELKVSQKIDIKFEEVNCQHDEVTNNTEREWFNFIRRTGEKIPVFPLACDRVFCFGKVYSQFPNLHVDALYELCREAGFSGDFHQTIHISRIVKKLFNNETIDIELSKMIQSCSNNITGTMYISIDPFDYLTMSMNKSNWNSCHSLHMNVNSNWSEWGCYSAGIFSYMCDEVSLIAFRTDGEQVKMGWNNRNIMLESKNWRQMLFLEKNKKFFIASRQYPFKSELLTKIIRQMFEDIIDQKKEIEEDNKKTVTTNKWIISRKEDRNKKKIFDNCDAADLYDDYDEDDDEAHSLHYNDMLNSWHYQFVYKDEFDKLDNIVIGCHPTCPICGKNILLNHNQPFCEECHSNHTELGD